GQFHHRPHAEPRRRNEIEASEEAEQVGLEVSHLAAGPPHFPMLVSLPSKSPPRGFGPTRARHGLGRAALGLKWLEDGEPRRAKAMTNGRCRYHGGMCTGPNIEAGKRHRAAETRAWWARWDRELGRQYMSAIAQRQVRKVRRILVAERARQGGL